MLAMKRCLTTKQRRSISPEFKQRTACLVLGQGLLPYECETRSSVVGPVLRRWAQQVQLECQGIKPNQQPIAREKVI
ncbi:MAG: hypothetical protein EPN70_13465 [Paraburkholderia sp.]|uniref:hypothetical protein n=1 Tax=Paraburkholderia sp. TaxID=1926495 RepID=UPI0012285CF7|nr:hypothetical protein [Paraburkholderia sp.]TAM03730.1 MAG: hypothetical protein EPN70_13465 [Paraburkholderia sp.]